MWKVFEFLMLNYKMMKMRRIVAWVLIFSILVISVGGLFGQNVVKDLGNVKRPALGKIYFSKKDSSLSLWKGKWVALDYGQTQQLEVVPPVVTPPIISPVVDEIQLGYWAAPERLLVAKLLNGRYHLMQTDANRSYYVPRGKNLIFNNQTKVNSQVLTSSLLQSLTSEDSGLGGLYPPTTFKDSFMSDKGFVKNKAGEWVFGNVQAPVLPQEPISVEAKPIVDKIKIPVGLIMWDNWERDYWNDKNPKYDYLINHISRNRYSATYWGDKFDLVPFYGQHVPAEKVIIRYNVKWNQQLGRNTYDSLEKSVTVRYDKNQADTEREVKYYRDAGFDFLCFNYYSDESYLSETRKYFVSMQNKLGMKMTFKIQRGRTNAEIDYITNLMTKDYWLHIDNKPVLYLNSDDFEDLNRYSSALRAKNGKDIYVVYYTFNGYPTDWQDYLQKRNDAICSYNTSAGSFSTQEQQIAKEVSDRESWMQQYKHTHVKIIPILSLGLENLDQRTDILKSDNPVTLVESANFEQINRKNVLIKDFINKYPDKVPAILWYSANEILEGGKSMIPKKLKDGRIDTSILDAVGRHLE